MPGIRVDRFLVSTAVFLVLSAAATAGAVADPQDAAPSNSPVNAAPDTSKAAAPPASSDQPVLAAPSTAPAAENATPAPSPSAASDAAPATASAPVAAPATAASADAPIADQLHNLASGGFDRLIGNKKDRAEIDAFYAGRNY